MAITSLTLGAGAQRVLRYMVCVCVCVDAFYVTIIILATKRPPISDIPTASEPPLRKKGLLYHGSFLGSVSVLFQSFTI